MRRLLAAVIIVLQVTAFLSIQHKAAGQEGRLEVHFIDVGQGDSILIITPNGRTMLVDGGPPSAASKVASYLQQNGITTLDLVVATHPDIDHIGGLVKVLKEFKVSRLVDSGKLYTTSTYFDYLEQIERHKIPVTIAKGEEDIRLDPNLSIHILNTQNAFKTNNQSSIALSLSYGQIDFLLMADVETTQEKKLLEQKKLDAEILKVAHHGSDTSTSFEFLREVTPDTAILSYSINNDFGHPVNRVVDSLQLVGANVYSTAKAGDIVIASDGKSYRVDVAGGERILTK
ncbi:ComEC/Rec2 family competence protein [Sediminibacillus albus]|uniref:Metal-dependent hydrolase, beta-lactamase superfamily II n=1 Tax=Sediminibacillus albus TaxID=407036 RepID=A0A1G9B573_9BACI|nr:MBL fold metallo-hydrolase [Sediminibacillus albus]SDK34727.1 Metal-dependent hydrolase, beta-lactamase superfamily II [Sediminibacillus albus]